VKIPEALYDSGKCVLIAGEEDVGPALAVLCSGAFPGLAFAELPDVELPGGPLPDGLGGKRPDVEALAVVHEVIDQRTLDLLPALCQLWRRLRGIDVAACATRACP
jgi:hypothetical protein